MSGCSPEPWTIGVPTSTEVTPATYLRSLRRCGRCLGAPLRDHVPARFQKKHMPILVVPVSTCVPGRKTLPVLLLQPTTPVPLPAPSSLRLSFLLNVSHFAHLVGPFRIACHAPSAHVRSMCCVAQLPCMGIAEHAMQISLSPHGDPPVVPSSRASWSMLFAVNFAVQWCIIAVGSTYSTEHAARFESMRSSRSMEHAPDQHMQLHLEHESNVHGTFQRGEMW